MNIALDGSIPGSSSLAAGLKKSYASGVRFSAIEDALYTWMSSTLQIPVIWADQGGPQPDYPFGTLKFIVGPRRIGSYDTVEMVIEDNEVRQYTVGVRELVLSCQVFCEAGNPISNSMSYLSILQDSLSLDSVADSLYASGIAIGTLTTPVSLDFRTDTGWVSRSNMDLTVRVISIQTEVINTIETINTEWIDVVNFVMEEPQG